MMGIWISGQKLPNYQITQLPNSQRAQASLQRETKFSQFLHNG
jgi:hypothetical protein